MKRFFSLLLLGLMGLVSSKGEARLDPESHAILSNPGYAKHIEVQCYLITREQVADLFSQNNDKGLPVEIKLIDGMNLVKEYDERARLKRLETRGRSISYSYDQRDHVKKVTSQDKETCFSYDAAGNLSSLTDPLNRTAYHDYDHFERLIQTIDPKKGMTSYEYASSGLSKINLPNGSNREIFYDDYGRPIAIR